MQKGSFSPATSFRRFYMRLTLLGCCFMYFSRLAGTQACPLHLSQQRVVVRYGDSVQVNCNTSVQHLGMGWESSVDPVSMTKDHNLITWRVPELTEWDIHPFCYINYKTSDQNIDQCTVELPVTVYKTPDSVSISTVNHTGPMTEGEMYKLQCDVHNVAPVQYLTVKWYKEQTLLDQNNFTDSIKTPVNEMVTLPIRAHRDDDGAQYWCEAELDLGAEGPQPPPTITSNPLNITVYYKPIINETKLPSVVYVVRGYEVALVCEAEGNPKPTISWTVGTNHNINSESLTISESTPEPVSCTASNSVGHVIRHVKVSIQDISISMNHRGPLIVGKQYELQCFIKNVDPSKDVVVKWYKLNKTISTDTIKTSARNTSKLQISPNKTDDGAQYWCKAELEAEGPQYYLLSEKMNIIVHYQPIINEIKLPSVVPVFRGYPEVLVCEAEGNPKPTISWSFIVNGIEQSTPGETYNLTESAPEDLYCIAKNSVNSTIRHVKVVLKDISISLNHRGPLIVGKQYELHCFIKNVDPSKDVVVKWYKLNKTISTDTFKTSARNTSKLQISPNKTDDGAQYWCKAELEAEGPQRYLLSAKINITVHYQPIINEIKLPSVVPVFRGYPEVLVCEAEGNPKPTISWSLSLNDIEQSTPGETYNLTESAPEDLYCIAKNSVNSTIKHVKVVLKDISISLNHRGPLIVGKQYELHCFIKNVDPSKDVDVKWYKLNKTISTDTFKTLVSTSSKLQISPNKTDDGAQYLCEAELEAEGPQRYLLSAKINITVHYQPIINNIKLPSVVPVFRGYPEVLVCEAEGNPKPTISWSLSLNDIEQSTPAETFNLTESAPEDLYCIAKNSVNSTIRHVKVVLKENYIRIILGIIVPVVVLVIFVIFIYIYLTYYKKSQDGPL